MHIMGIMPELCAKRIQEPCLPGTPADGDARDPDGRTAQPT